MAMDDTRMNNPAEDLSALEFDSSDLDGGAGLAADESGFVLEADDSLSVDDGGLDLLSEGLSEFADDDAEFADLDLGAELLFTESDISAIAFDYYQNVKAIQEKLQPPANSAEDDFTISSADFPYLESRQLAPLCLAIKEQAKIQCELRESERYSPKENAEKIFDALSSSFPFHVGSNYGTFIDTCAREYERYFKRATVSAAQTSTKFEQLLDKERMELSQFVFTINGLLWNQITLVLNDASVQRDQPVNYMLNGRAIYHCGIIGNAMSMYNEYRKANGDRPVMVNTMTVGDLVDCVNYTLSYQNMMGTLHLSQTDVANLSTGELLRRYLLLEKEEELLELTSFRPTHEVVNSVTATTFERVNVQFSENPTERAGQIAATYDFLRAPFYTEGRSKVAITTDSITHELLYYVLLIYYRGVDDKRSNPRAYEEFLMLLTPYLIGVMLNTPYVHPVIYFTPNPIPDSDNEFELNYYLGEKYYSVREHGLLVNVVGDQRSAYVIPFVTAVDRDSRNVSCPADEAAGTRVNCPPCVVFPLHQLFLDLQVATKSAGAASKKMRIDGTTEYCYTPSLAWVVSRSYASQQDIEDAYEGEQRVTRTSNPLLNTLLTYTNSFEPERFPVSAGAVNTSEGLTVLYISEGADTPAGVNTRLIEVLQGEDVVSDKGTLGFDETDGSLIMRFFEGEGDNEQGRTVIAKHGTYDINELSAAEHDVKRMPPVTSYVDLGPTPPAYLHSLPELRSINKRLCALNALEYEEELADARAIIMRDLKNVVVSYHMDTLLACKLLAEYCATIKPGDSVDSVNFDSFKAISRIIVGPNPALDDKVAWDDECLTIARQTLKASAIQVSDLCIYLDQYDPNVLALQGLSNSETSNVVEYNRYMALHALPGVHERLRDLEERMLLLRILREIGSDIVPILRKRSPMLTAYNDVTTADTLDDVESSLKSGMKGGKQFDAFPLTRKVLSAEVGGSTPILKYFALERNVHGIMATAMYSEDEQERTIYQKLEECLGLNAAGMPRLSQMDERTFLNAPFAVSLETACSRNRVLLLRLIERGLLAEASASVDLYVLKAFDLLTTYGLDLFDLKAGGIENPHAEDYDDIGEYLPYFYSYVGSFLVSYCYLQDEAAAIEASSPDRVVAYREGGSGFTHSTDLSLFAEYELTDMRTVISE